MKSEELFIINKCEKPSSQTPPRHTYPNKPSPVKEDLGQHPRTTLKDVMSLLAEVFLEGQQSGQHFTNLGFTAEWLGGDDS